MMVAPYQPRWVKGQATTDGQRDAAKRYLAIKDALDDARVAEHVTPSSALDLGAYGGYFSFRLAEDFLMRVVAVDDHPELRRGVKANNNPLVEGVYDRLSAAEVRELGTFDVTLALSLLHHVPGWEEMLATILDMTQQFLFIETPGPDEHLPTAINELKPIWTAVENLGGETIAEVAGYDGRYTRELKVVRMW